MGVHIPFLQKGVTVHHLLLFGEVLADGVEQQCGSVEDLGLDGCSIDRLMSGLRS